MFKKILSILCTAALAVSVSFTAFADTTSTDTETIYFDRTGAPYVILTGYDNNGTLLGLRVCELTEENGRSYIKTETFDGVAKVRAYFPGDTSAQTIKSAGTDTPGATATPAPSTPPSATPSASASPSAKPEKSFPAVYPHEIDAIRAPALVKNTSIALSGKTGETVVKLDLLYQGKDYPLEVEQGFALNSVPDTLSDASGMTADNLEKGDIIDMSFYLSGELKTLNLIMRPAEENIMTSDTDYGASFEKLFSSNGVVAGNSSYKLLKYGSGSFAAQYGYAFGVLTDKTSTDITLMNKVGKEDQALNFSLDPATVVYVCDMSNKKEIYQESISALSKTNVPKSSMDENGNVINWSQDQTYNYVFVRTVEDTAADIVIYTNYNDR